MNHKVSIITILALLMACFMAVPVYAYVYYAPVSVTENGTASYNMLAVNFDVDNEWLADNGFINSTGLDTRIETLGGSEKPHMLTDNKTYFAIPVGLSSQTNLYYTTWNTALPNFNIVLGYDGYYNVTDHANLELAANFTSEFNGWWDTDTIGAMGVDKPAAYITSTTATGNITSAIATTTDPEEPTGFSDPGNDWFNEPNAYDNDTSTYAEDQAGDGFDYLILTTPAIVCSGASWNVTDGASTFVSIVNIDLYYDGDWHNFHDGTLEDGYYYQLATIPAVVTQARIKMTDTNNVRLIEFDFFEALSVTADGLDSDDYKVTTTADNVNLKIYIDDVEQDSVALGGVSVPNNANTWSFMQENGNPYLHYYSHTINGVEVARYEPTDMISGFTLPDEVGAYDGTIVWGDNPANVALTLGSLASSSQPLPGETEEDGIIDILPKAEASDWFVAPDVTGTLLTNPLRPLVTMLSDNTDLSEMQAWRLYALALVLLVTVGTARVVRGHHLITGIASGTSIGGGVALTIFPLWSLVFVILAVTAGAIAERSPSL